LETRFYNIKDQQIDIEALAGQLVNVYRSQGYAAQFVGNKDNGLVQLKKGGDFEAIIGLQAALSISLQSTSGGVTATAGQQKWIDKVTLGAASFFVPVLAPLAITAGLGAVRQLKLASQAFSMLDGLVRQQYPDVQFEPTNSGHGTGFPGF
jgi:hypothetical protein